MCLLSACGTTSAEVDGGQHDGSFFDVHPDAADLDACASCGRSLTAACAMDASNQAFPWALPCPPDLGSPAFDTWARERVSAQYAPLVPICSQLAACPENVIITFNNGTDCTIQYIFDVKTKKPVAIANACNASVGCYAADGCIPSRCLSGDPPAGYFADCPPMPDGGISDAGAE